MYRTLAEAAAGATGSCRRGCEGCCGVRDGERVSYIDLAVTTLRRGPGIR